jgi:hypothetical protein
MESLNNAFEQWFYILRNGDIVLLGNCGVKSSVTTNLPFVYFDTEEELQTDINNLFGDGYYKEAVETGLNNKYCYPSNLYSPVLKEWYVIYNSNLLNLNKTIYRLGFGSDGGAFVEDNKIKEFKTEEELEQWVDDHKEPGFYQWQAENLTEIFSPESLKYKPK